MIWVVLVVLILVLGKAHASAPSTQAANLAGLSPGDTIANDLATTAFLFQSLGGPQLTNPSNFVQGGNNQVTVTPSGEVAATDNAGNSSMNGLFSTPAGPPAPIFNSSGGFTGFTPAGGTDPNQGLQFGPPDAMGNLPTITGDNSTDPNFNFGGFVS